MDIAVIWGDCSSPEIVKQTSACWTRWPKSTATPSTTPTAAMGGEAIDKYGDPLPQHELDKCLAADSVLLGAVGGPKWEGLPGEQRRRRACCGCAPGMGLYANNRPPRSGRSWLRPAP